MRPHMPRSPFTTRLSGSARETEQRIRSIFQWHKKRPPLWVLVLAAVLILLCGGLVSCRQSTPYLSDVASGRVDQESLRDTLVQAAQEFLTDTPAQADIPSAETQLIACIRRRGKKSPGCGASANRYRLFLCPGGPGPDQRPAYRPHLPYRRRGRHASRDHLLQRWGGLPSLYR